MIFPVIQSNFLFQIADVLGPFVNIWLLGGCLNPVFILLNGARSNFSISLVDYLGIDGNQEFGVCFICKKLSLSNLSIISDLPQCFLHFSTLSLACCNFFF